MPVLSHPDSTAASNNAVRMSTMLVRVFRMGSFPERHIQPYVRGSEEI